MAEWISLVLGIMGVAGLIFTALRYRRDDTTAVVNQQSTILTNMKTLLDAEEIQLRGVTQERDKLAVEVERLREQVDRLAEA